MIPAMNANEVLQAAAAAMVSLGGGGAIVFSLAGYLGKRWADRGLERQKQEYAQLNIAFTHQLELASKQVQMELERLGHLHKLRTESEFQKLSNLWRCMARLRFAFTGLPRERYDLKASDKEAHHQSHLKFSNAFFDRWNEAFQVWNEEALSIPKNISEAATDLLMIAHHELTSVLEYKDPFDEDSLAILGEKALTDLLDKRSKRVAEFSSKSQKLLATMREHLEGNTSAPKGQAQ